MHRHNNKYTTLFRLKNCNPSILFKNNDILVNQRFVNYSYNNNGIKNNAEKEDESHFIAPEINPS